MTDYRDNMPERYARLVTARLARVTHLRRARPRFALPRKLFSGSLSEIHEDRIEGTEGSPSLRE